MWDFICKLLRTLNRMETRDGRNVSQEVEEDESSDSEMAVSHGCVKFSEVWDPIAAMRWISHMEDVFKDMKCGDDDKVAYGISMLRSEASVWWDTVKDTSGLEIPTKMTWNRFKELFKEEFYPISVSWN